MTVRHTRWEVLFGQKRVTIAPENESGMGGNTLKEESWA